MAVAAAAAAETEVEVRMTLVRWSILACSVICSSDCWFSSSCIWCGSTAQPNDDEDDESACEGEDDECTCEDEDDECTCEDEDDECTCTGGAGAQRRTSAFSACRRSSSFAAATVSVDATEDGKESVLALALRSPPTDAASFSVT